MSQQYFNVSEPLFEIDYNYTIIGAVPP